MIAGEDVRTKLDRLAACLEWASRTNPTGESARWLRRHITDPDVLDYLERLVMAQREREQ